MKKVILLGISLSLLILISPVNSVNNQYALNDLTKSTETPIGHPILPPV